MTELQKKIKIKGDYRLWWWYIIMLLVAVVLTSSSTANLSILSKGNVTSYWLKHIVFMSLGLGIVYIFSRLPREYINLLYLLADYFLYFSLGLVFLTMFIGVEKADAKRWLSLFGFQFQPSEIARLSLIIYAAKELTMTIKAKSKKEKYNILNKLFWLSLFTSALVGANNLSSGLIILAIIFGMIAIAEIPQDIKTKLLKRLVLLSLAGLTVVILFPGKFFRNQTWKSRITQMLHPRYSYTDQSTQAKIAIAKGGLISFNLGKGVQKALIPQEYSDYLFSVIVEETGLLGGLIVIIFYIALMFILAKIMSRLKRVFLLYMIAGFGLSIEIQAFIHILVNVGLFPVTGQPLPFLSLGGTSVLVNSTMIGLIISFSRFVKKNPQPTTNEPVDITFNEKTKIIVG